MGRTGPVEAELYKLLVYDTGSFFVRHRDSEKAPGMFATLVVVLPSDYSGGELLVRHKGREVRLDLQRDEPSEAAFAAFYADCLHEVLPIASGHRLALIYNLIRKNKSPLPKPPDYEREQQQAVGLLRMWSRGDTSVSRAVPDSNSGPTKLIYPLEHAYTQAELEFATLTAQDARSHVEGSIRSINCDLDFVTEKKGQPCTLRCTKNQASYQRRGEQWRQDLAHLARLGSSTEDGAVATRVDDR